MPLTHKQRLFVEEYCVDRNGTQAAIRAGYAPGSAEVTASRLLSYTKVSRAVACALAQLEKRINVDAVRVLTEYARIAFADVTQAFDASGNLLALRDMPYDLRRAIASFEVVTHQGEDGRTSTRLAKVKFHPKPQALEALGKHLQLFVDKVELGGESGPVTITINRQVKP